VNLPGKLGIGLDAGLDCLIGPNSGLDCLIGPDSGLDCLIRLDSKTLHRVAIAGTVTTKFDDFSNTPGVGSGAVVAMQK